MQNKPLLKMLKTCDITSLLNIISAYTRLGVAINASIFITVIGSFLSVTSLNRIGAIS